MSKALKALMLVALASLVLVALIGCASGEEPQPSAGEQVEEQVEESTDAKQAAVDEAINSAQSAVSQLITVGDGLETRVDGLQVKSDLQELQRKLTAAQEQTGDAKVAAIDGLSETFDNLIYRVEMAAGKAPAGGELQTELNDLAARLKAAQADLADAAASYAE